MRFFGAWLSSNLVPLLDVDVCVCVCICFCFGFWFVVVIGVRTGTRRIRRATTSVSLVRFRFCREFVCVPCISDRKRVVHAIRGRCMTIRLPSIRLRGTARMSVSDVLACLRGRVCLNKAASSLKNCCQLKS